MEKTKTHNDGGKNPQWNDVGWFYHRPSLSIRSTKKRSSSRCGIRTQALRTIWSALPITISAVSWNRRKQTSGSRYDIRGRSLVMSKWSFNSSPIRLIRSQVPLLLLPPPPPSSTCKDLVIDSLIISCCCTCLRCSSSRIWRSCLLHRRLSTCSATPSSTRLWRVPASCSCLWNCSSSLSRLWRCPSSRWVPTSPRSRRLSPSSWNWVSCSPWNRLPTSPRIPSSAACTISSGRVSSSAGRVLPSAGLLISLFLIKI